MRAVSARHIPLRHGWLCATEQASAPSRSRWEAGTPRPILRHGAIVMCPRYLIPIRPTHETLAKKAGVTHAYLAHLEMGRHDPPLSRLRKLAKALGVPVTESLE